jgi:hypothetical protein
VYSPELLHSPFRAPIERRAAYPQLEAILPSLPNGNFVSARNTSFNLESPDL